MTSESRDTTRARRGLRGGRVDWEREESTYSEREREIERKIER